MSSSQAGRGRDERSGAGEFESGLDYGSFVEEEPEAERTQVLPRAAEPDARHAGGAPAGDQHTTALDPGELARLRGADAGEPSSGSRGSVPAHASAPVHASSSASASAPDIVASRPVATTTSYEPAPAQPAAWAGAAPVAEGSHPAGADVASGPTPEESARLPKAGPRIAQTLLAVLAPFVLLLTAVKLVASPLFLWLEYHRPGFPGDRFGFTTDDRMHYGSAGLDYLNNMAGTRYLSSLTHEGAPLFTAPEVSHMADVKTVMLWSTVALVVLALVCLALLVYLAKNSIGGVRRALFAAASWFLVALLVLAVLAVLGWETFFAGFHSLFFADGTWTFSAQDALIRLYPSQFWVDAAVSVAVLSLLTALATLLATWPTRRRRERSADQRAALQATRLRWAREDQAEVR